MTSLQSFDSVLTHWFDELTTGLLKASPEQVGRKSHASKPVGRMVHLLVKYPG